MVTLPTSASSMYPKLSGCPASTTLLYSYEPVFIDGMPHGPGEFHEDFLHSLEAVAVAGSSAGGKGISSLQGKVTSVPE